MSETLIVSAETNCVLHIVSNNSFSNLLWDMFNKLDNDLYEHSAE